MDQSVKLVVKILLVFSRWRSNRELYERYYYFFRNFLNTILKFEFNQT